MLVSLLFSFWREHDRLDRISYRGSMARLRHGVEDSMCRASFRHCLNLPRSVNRDRRSCVNDSCSMHYGLDLWRRMDRHRCRRVEDCLGVYQRLGLSGGSDGDWCRFLDDSFENWRHRVEDRRGM